MFKEKSRVECEEKHRQNDARNNGYIQRVNYSRHRDKIVENVFLRSTEENPYTRQVNNSIQICSELKEDARKRFLEEKRRQQLRANNQELKQLENQLRTAYVQKAVTAQIFEREALKKQRKDVEKDMYHQLAQARLKTDEALKKSEEEKRSKGAIFKAGLQKQIAMSNAQRAAEYEALLKEKEIMDEAVRKCKEDQLREEREAIEKKLRVKAEMEEFKKLQDAHKAAQTQASENENDRILELLKKRDMDLQKAKEEKLKERLRKEEISKKIGQHVHEIQLEQNKNREYLVELLIDERIAKEELELREKLEKQMQQRAATLMQLHKDREEKERRKLADQKLEEEHFKEEMRILAERDKLAQLSDEKRRRKQLEHRRALQDALNEKKRLKAEQMKEYLNAREKDLEAVEKANKLVEEERIRMIKEHVPGLLGFLGPGVLRDSDKKLVSMPPK